jgi:Domain of unknown function (DUF3806)
MAQRISDLNESERNWLTGNFELAGAIAQTYGLPVEPGDRLDPKTLDVAWTVWLGSHNHGVDDPNPYVNAFGVALGQHLVDHLGLEWKVVEDEGGTEMAVWGKAGDVLVFPANLVGKRYAARTTDFFATIASEIEDRVRHVQGQGLAKPSS